MQRLGKSSLQDRLKIHFLDKITTYQYTIIIGKSLLFSQGSNAGGSVVDWSKGQVCNTWHTIPQDGLIMAKTSQTGHGTFAEEGLEINNASVPYIVQYQSNTTRYTTYMAYVKKGDIIKEHLAGPLMFYPCR